MKKGLVVVESPTKAKTISKMLGKNYKVIATVGHLRDLPKSKLGVDLEKNFEPQYITVRGKGQKVKELKTEYQKADTIILATDPDREGEAISWHLANLLNLNPEDKNRVEFHEITKESVKKAIVQPRSIDMNLVNAQQARRILDRIVGYKLSPILWKKIKSGLSAGRVQSVALKLICDREDQINAFVKEEYWTITANHKEQNIAFDSNFVGLWKEGKLIKKELKNEEKADEIIRELDLQNFIVQSIKKSKKRRNPYPPYTTSTLQQDASHKLGFSTSKTMKVAQQLYEGISIGDEGNVGLISYMRTDSTRLSENIVKEALSYIQQNYGPPYVSKGNTYGKNKKKVQDAHEAIRPSAIARTPDKMREFLSNDQVKLYQLIWNRVVASQMTASIYESTSVILLNGQYGFKANGNVVIFDGFTKLSDKEDKETILPELKEASVIAALGLKKEQHFTKPPARYSEASLVKALEEDGIGRPSTYTSIINNILTRGYVELANKYLFPTELGITVNNFLMRYFQTIINEEFTAKMEDHLDRIADQSMDWKEVIGEFYYDFDPYLQLALNDQDDFKIADQVLDEKCPLCQSNLVIKSGRNGKFIGCQGFPQCKYTKAMVKKIGVKCPRCGGELIEKLSKKGKLFYGCDQYPSCDFAVWDKPTGKPCPNCGEPLVLKQNKKHNQVKCSNENCDYIELQEND